MILILHILIALTSVVYSGYVFLSPTKRRLRISYSLVCLTLFSGIYLVAVRHSPLLAACTSGLIYLGAVLTGLAAAQRKLHPEE
jgi:hypothetical protein